MPCQGGYICTSDGWVATVNEACQLGYVQPVAMALALKIDTHHGYVQPVFSELHGVGCILEGILWVHSLVLWAQAWRHGVHKSCYVGAVIPVSGEVGDVLVRQLFLQISTDFMLQWTPQMCTVSLKTPLCSAPMR